MFEQILLFQEPGSATVGATDVPWSHLSLALGLVLIAVGISRWQSLGLVKDFLIGTLRTVVQLTLVGYVLVYVFALDRWYVTLSILLVMLAVAVNTAIGRQRGSGPYLKWITGAAMLLGSAFTLIYVTTLVVHATPWYDPRYLIPIFGMIVGASMNGASLAVERLTSEMMSHAAEIEAYLALGATYQQASEGPLRQALRASLIPTINGLMVVGIVTLPGMMTGQILAGASPLTAVRYQIVVAFMQAAATAITTATITLLHRRTFFTPALQFQPPA